MRGFRSTASSLGIGALGKLWTGLDVEMMPGIAQLCREIKRIHVTWILEVSVFSGNSPRSLPYPLMVDLRVY